MDLITLFFLINVHAEYLQSNFVQGQYMNVKIVDSCLYYCTLRGLEIYDCADPTNPELAGSAHTAGNATSVDVAGDYVFLADQYNGLCIFDVTYRANPFLIGHYDSEGCTEYVVVKDTFVYLADGDHGLVIINVSDPSNPFYVGSWTQANYYAFTVFVADSIAYLGNISHDPLKIINVTDPTNPFLIADFPQVPHPTSQIVCAYVVDTLAFLAGSWWLGESYSNFLVANIADPVNPLLVSNMHLGEPALGVTVAGENAYVSNQDEGVRIIDVSNPVMPIEIGHFGESVYYGYGCAVQDTLLIVPKSLEGFSIADVSDPSNPVMLFRKPNYRYTTFAIEDSQRNLFLFGAVNISALFHSTLSFIDIDDIMSPLVRAEMSFLGWWQLWFRGPGLVTDYPYLVFGLNRNADDFLGVVDITNIGQPQLLRFDPGTTAGPLAFVYPYIYAGYNDKLMIGDVNASPIWIDSIALPDVCNGIAINDSVSYVACRYHLAILDLNTDSLITTYFHGHQYAGCNGGVILDLPYLYMSYVTDSAGVVYNGFLVFDVSNPNMPALLSTTMTHEPLPWYISGGNAKSCYIDDNLLFHCRGTAGFDVYDVSNPVSPILVLTQDTPYSCDDIHVINDTILVMDELSLEIYRLVDTGVDDMCFSNYPQQVCVLEICPDPFRGQTCISYDFGIFTGELSNIPARMEIYDISGRLLRSFTDLSENRRQIIWHGEDDNGRALPQGVYFVRLVRGADFYVRKVVLLR